MRRQHEHEPWPRLRYKTISSLLLALIGVYAAKNFVALVREEMRSSHDASYQWLPPDSSGGVAMSTPFRKEVYHPSRRSTNGTATTMPIHLIQPSTGHSSALSWRTLASIWDRHATFDDLMEISPPSRLPPVHPRHRVAIVIHCAPKMGSRTLRNACRENLRSSCGMESVGKVDPDGYRNINWLGDVIRQCDATHHFCLGRGMRMNKKEPGRFDGTTFLHLYPFRNYDEWTISALKMPYDRGGSRGCDILRTMVDACEDKHGELAFYKYPKVWMSKDWPVMVRRVTEFGEPHHILLYPFKEADAVLNVLSEVYRIPTLPGSNGTDHANRPKNGTCDGKILDRFHECFTFKLTELP